ncbi:hypothetical protein CVT25_005214 [Psilocybe cyanescens]|uniref:Uncharacterized protein n=1 Tax=Psilocybe cyanescens TaxID=93625 RepID=A0A409XRS4_PSICY|nr:hypothetical protein CVT25_005214 [Psilocybe cyanescens]
MDKHFYFHNLDKHCTSANFLGNFTYENYCQALEKIQIDLPCLTQLLMQLKINQEDYKKYLKSECKYLAGLHTEPAEEQASTEYIVIVSGNPMVHSRLPIPDSLKKLTLNEG